MKTAAVVLMVLGILLLLGLGLMYLHGFALSFDSPGSANDPKAWLMRVLMFLPILILLIALIWSFIAYRGGNYKRSVIINSTLAGVFIVLFASLMISSFMSMGKYKSQMNKQAENTRLYPVEKYLRQVEGGTDTIIVFPNQIVAYRLYRGTNIPWAGPLGDLNEKRDTVYYHVSTDTKIAMNELDQFVDARGRKFAEEYTTINRKK